MNKIIHILHLIVIAVAFASCDYPEKIDVSASPSMDDYLRTQLSNAEKDDLTKKAWSGDISAAKRLEEHYDFRREIEKSHFWRTWAADMGDADFIEWKAESLYVLSSDFDDNDKRKLFLLRNAKHYEEMLIELNGLDRSQDDYMKSIDREIDRITN